MPKPARNAKQEALPRAEPGGAVRGDEKRGAVVYCVYPTACPGRLPIGRTLPKWRCPGHDGLTPDWGICPFCGGKAYLKYKHKALKCTDCHKIYYYGRMV